MSENMQAGLRPQQPRRARNLNKITFSELLASLTPLSEQPSSSDPQWYLVKTLQASSDKATVFSALQGDPTHYYVRRVESFELYDLYRKGGKKPDAQA